MSGLKYLCVLLALCWIGVTGARLNCEVVRPIFESHGFPSSDIPKDPISSRELRSCGGISSGGEVCCTADMELRLQAKARDRHEKATKSTLQRLQQLLATRGARFHTFFKDLLATSKKGFHEMFKKTYGILYEQNAYVFTDLFDELENYYTTGTVNLDEAMDNFFNTLYQKMFTVLNSQYNFDAKYLECVGNHMKDMRPFGDVPQKLGVQIKRSFIATRAFSQALTVAADVLKNMQTLKVSPECAAALTRMTACPSCSGIPGNVLACGDMCANVMKGCLTQHAALDGEWNHFVEAVGKVGERLLGPFNIEMLVRPINLKISEAIMNFQENSHDVSQRVFSGCGRPVLGRRKRRRRSPSAAAAARDVDFDSGNFDQESGEDGRSATAVMLDKLVKEIRQRVRDSRQFWIYLPYQLCNDGLVVPPSNTKECWNGTHVDKYLYPVSSDGETQTLNPEVRGAGPRAPIVRDQIFALTTITSRLRSAFNGQDVDWIDAEEIPEGSGSGSGDGADEDPITDDEDGFSEESSGYEPKSAEPIPPKAAAPVPAAVPPQVDIKPKVPSVDVNNVDPHPDSGSVSNTDTSHNSTTTATDSGGSTSGAASRQRMSLTRALTSYLFPIAVMWFGGCLTEWL
ncbi:glypican-6 [Microplitis mediator]|uniref:glypican-6 n=1 Tax=Microplitis mediator TaxID=375433 RepID=UPI002553FA36|nr:glypican-6 [Microplitis mediator]